MAHWAKLDDNNIVVNVVVTSNEEPDEGYQWLVDNFGGSWIKTSYNTYLGKHLFGGVPVRGNYAGIGFKYHNDIDAFMPLSPFPSWHINTKTYSWEAPSFPPDSGMWEWNEESKSWTEMVIDE
jgi:hypothetical protein